MRKILLTTTALVALGGVSAASADISISGKASYTYVSGSGTGFATDSNSNTTTTDFDIDGSRVLDNGLTVTGKISLDEGGVDDDGFTIVGDFGTLAFGGLANDSHGAAAIDVTADEGHGFTPSTTTAGATANYDAMLPGDEAIPHSDVSWALSIGDVGVSLGMVNGATSSADSTQIGATYSTTAGGMTVTAGYAQSSSGAANSDITNANVKLATGGMSATLMSGSNGLLNNSGIGVTYAVSGALTVQAYSGTTDHDTNATFEVKDTGIGLTYTIVDGMTVSVTNNDYSGKGDATLGAESGSRTAVALDITF